MSFSGRTDTWSQVVTYCIQHPQGMGYIAGLRASHFTAGSKDPVMNKMGGTDDSYFEVLADGGWLGLALYLLILVKVFHLGWRYVKNRRPMSQDRNGLNRNDMDVEANCRHAISCSLLLLVFCLIDAVDASEFALPMMQPYYFQWITMAILMGAASTVILARRRHRLERQRAANPLTNSPIRSSPRSLPRWS